MRLLAAGIATLCVAVGTMAVAQDRDVRPIEKGQQREALSPEAWAYVQELQRQNDPKMNAIRAAQYKAEQRRLRLESQKWYGYSNLRPVVSPTPMMGHYSPAWAGNAMNEYYWYGAGYPATAVYVDQNVIYTR